VNLSFKDIPALGRPLIVLGALLALAVGGAMYTGKLVKQSKSELTAAQAKLAEARKRVMQSGDEVRTLQKFIGPYHQLEQRGVVGEEQRLNWVDALRVANIDAHLYGVDYEVGAQTPYAFAQEVGAGNLPVQQSIMKLKLGLLYETDLLNFFGLLGAQNVGAFSVNQCTLQRIAAEVFKPVNQPMLRAECDVAWVTIPPPATSAKGS
jgi:hypothetical protein